MWNERFHKFMFKIGFRRCNSDQCLYVKFEGNIIGYVLLYVDDLVIVSNNMQMIHKVKNNMINEFEMSMENCKPIATPIENGLQLEKAESDHQCRAPYRELIGCLTYATITTRPDLCASTNYMSQFQNCYNDDHFGCAKRILRYLQGTIDLKLTYHRNESAPILVGYTDADWANSRIDRKSISGYVFKIFGNAVSWSLRKQSTISLSSTEAEYVSLSQGTCGAIWLQNLLTEMGFKEIYPTTIYEDNQACIKIAEEPRDHRKMKHVDVRYKFIREAISNGKIKVEYMPTGEQIADIMTKRLGKTLLEKHRNGLNLV